MKRLLIIIVIFIGTLFNQSLANTKMISHETNQEIFDSLIRDRIKSFASEYEGYRYVWGAVGPNSFDCSGFTSFVLKNFNYKHINRTAKDQYKQGITKSVDDAKPGDLIFFSSRGRFIGHVGMITGRDEDGTLTFIHAASSKSGVIHSKLTGYYIRRFVGIRDIISLTRKENP